MSTRKSWPAGACPEPSQARTRKTAGPLRGWPASVGERESAAPAQRAAARGTRTCRGPLAHRRPPACFGVASGAFNDTRVRGRWPEPLSQLDIGAGRDEPLRAPSASRVASAIRPGCRRARPAAEAVRSCGPGALSPRRALRDRRGRAPRVRVRVALNRGRYRLTFVATARKRYSSVRTRRRRRTCSRRTGGGPFPCTRRRGCRCTRGRRPGRTACCSASPAP